MDQTLFKTHFAGKDGFVWWIGQVASEESWLPNFPSKPGEEAPGVGERYKVRIMAVSYTHLTLPTNREV